MASQAALRQFRRAQNDIVTLAERELRQFWNSIDTSNYRTAIRALELFLPEIIQQYGEIGAAVARDFYDELRQEAGIRKAYRSVIGEAIPIEQARASTRWAVGPFFDNNPTQVMNNLVLITDRYVKQQARDTIHLNALRDSVRTRYARVPSGSETCAFCLTLASRGAVYANEASASKKYHAKCDCQPVPIWTDSDYPDGYDPEALRARYEKARETADTNSLKGEGGILQALRNEEGIN